MVLRNRNISADTTIQSKIHKFKQTLPQNKVQTPKIHHIERKRNIHDSVDISSSNEKLHLLAMRTRERLPRRFYENKPAMMSKKPNLPR